MDTRPTPDLNAGVDFERARARLNAAAGQAFRAWLQIKNTPDTAADAAEAARLAYEQASARCRQLSRSDRPTILGVLQGPSS